MAISNNYFPCSRWSRREEADFYRVVSTFGVERDRKTGEFKWDMFRSLARLEKKYDDTLTDYCKAFYHMCMRVCRKFKTEEEGNDRLELNKKLAGLQFSLQSVSVIWCTVYDHQCCGHFLTQFSVQFLYHERNGEINCISQIACENLA